MAVNGDCRYWMLKEDHIQVDPGSQSNLITEALINRLRFPRHSSNTPIIGINQMASLARDVVKVLLISFIILTEEKLTVLF